MRYPSCLRQEGSGPQLLIVSNASPLFPFDPALACLIPLDVPAANRTMYPTLLDVSNTFFCETFDADPVCGLLGLTMWLSHCVLDSSSCHAYRLARCNGSPAFILLCVLLLRVHMPSSTVALIIWC